MRATIGEEAATQALRENCARRDVAYSVKERTNGTWRGVVFGLGAEAQCVCVSRETRLLLLAALSRIVLERWPLRRGRPVERRAAA